MAKRKARVAAGKKQIMDVAKPGKAAATATSRPIIVNHGNLIKDPMVKDTDELPGDMATKPEEKLEAHRNKTIAVPGTESDNSSEPSTEPTAPAVETTTAEDTDADTDVSESEPAAVAADDTDKSDAAEDSGSSESSDEAVIETVANQAADKKKKQNTEDDERQKQISKLVEDKTYYVPTKEPVSRRSGRALLVLLAVVLVGAIGGYALIDLGVIKPGFDVPFHVLKKEKKIEQSTQAAQNTAPTTTKTTTPATQSPTKLTTLAQLGVSHTEIAALGVAKYSAVPTGIADGKVTAGSFANFTYKPTYKNLTNVGVTVEGSSKGFTYTARDTERFICEFRSWAEFEVAHKELAAKPNVVISDTTGQFYYAFNNVFSGTISIYGYKQVTTKLGSDLVCVKGEYTAPAAVAGKSSLTEKDIDPTFYADYKKLFSSLTSSTAQ